MINLKRDIYSRLIQWKNSKNRKPLILKGARQVGKTFIVKEFGNRNYENIAYFNFEADKRLNDFFKVQLNPDKIIENLSIYSNNRINPRKTLIIFDEVQESPETITSLKYFNEQANEYHIISSGSLLGIKHGQRTSAPVGKVTFMTLYPMTFGEFLSGVGEDKLRNILTEKKDFNELEKGFHEKLIELLKYYFFIGGMPQAVSQYVADRDFNEIRHIQKDIINAYVMDFAKHTSKANAGKILNAWNSIPGQLTKENKKFKYADIEKNAKARKYKEPLNWLIDIGAVHASYNITGPKLPLSAYAQKSKFKLFFIDTGLLGAMLDLSSRTIVERNKLFMHYNGAFTENYAAQELIASGHSDLYYWTSGNLAEIDFILSHDENIYPFEIKSGLNTKAKSLKVYKEKYNPSILSRASLRNFSKTGNMHDYPLYAVSLFPIRK